MKLFIVTGGKGERLYPLTKDIPKPMVEIAGKPVLHHLLDWAKDNGLKEVVMLNGYKADKVVDYFGDGKRFGMNITHLTETTPLGSGGCLKAASHLIDGRFVYLSGDVLCGIDLQRMLKFHEEKGADMTVHVHKSYHPQDSDIIDLDSEGRALRFVSKHESHTNAGNLTNSGLSILEKSVLSLMEEDKFTYETYLYPRAISSGMRMFGHNTDEFIADMGTPERLEKCKDFLIAKGGKRL